MRAFKKFISKQSLWDRVSFIKFSHKKKTSRALIISNSMAHRAPVLCRERVSDDIILVTFSPGLSLSESSFLDF